MTSNKVLCGMQGLFLGLNEEDFRVDLSSTEIRKKMAELKAA